MPRYRCDKANYDNIRHAVAERLARDTGYRVKEAWISLKQELRLLYPQISRKV
jgi:hypothetical protein